MGNINDYTELLVGFDAREAHLDFTTTWDESRRKLFLLKQNLIKPLSTDVMVWNSGFRSQPQIVFPGAISGTHLWISLEEMKSHLHELDPDIIPSYWLIAVTRWVKKTEVADFYPIEWPVNYERLSLLGYDVSDWVYLSGLTNCGYGDDEIESLKQNWGQKLNDYHLLTELQDAFAFAELSDTRVREHAPFSVYSLYLIEKHDPLQIGI